jgi:hypothetical protein
VGIVALSSNAPTAQRYVFAAPAVAVTLALGLDRAVGWLAGRLAPIRWGAGLVAGLAIAAIGSYDLYYYFRVYSGERRFGDYHVEVAGALAEYLARESAPPYVYFFGQPRMGLRTLDTIAYLAPQAGGCWCRFGRAELRLNQSTAFVLPHRLDDVRWVVLRCPGGEMLLRTARAYTLFALTGEPNRSCALWRGERAGRQP